MSKSAFLVQRGNSLSIRLAVPRSLWSVMGRQQIWAALGTSDPVEAKRRRGLVEAAIRSEFERAWRGGQPAIREAIERALGKRSNSLTSFARSLRGLPDAEELLGIKIDQAAEKVVRHVPATDTEDAQEVYPEAFTSEARAAFKVLAGNGALLSDAIERHLKDLADSKRVASWQKSVKRELEAFAGWLRYDVDVAELTRQMGAQYASERVGPLAGSPVTRKNRLGVLRGFGRWLEVHGLRESNPFAHITGIVKETKRGDIDAGKRGYTLEETYSLLTGLRDRLPKGDPLLYLTVLGFYTGARVEELCRLKSGDVVNGGFVIRKGKNRTSGRRTPVHPVIAPLVERLVAQADGGYLIGGLSESGTDKKRAHSVSTRFRRWLDRLGITERVDFHSTRRSLHTRCESAGLPEEMTDRLAGRKRAGLSYGTYSDGPDWQRLVDAMGKVSYGAEVDALVKSL